MKPCVFGQCEHKSFKWASCKNPKILDEIITREENGLNSLARQVPASYGPENWWVVKRGADGRSAYFFPTKEDAEACTLPLSNT